MLAGQTSVSQDNNTISAAYTGGDLDIDIRLENWDIYSDMTHVIQDICDFEGTIPAADMAALPLTNYTIADPAGNCEIIINVESFP